MLYYYFDLRDYFDNTQRYFYFLDGLFKNCERTKKEILDELLIPDSTYRTNRLKSKAKHDWTYLPIVKFFGYNTVDSKKQKQYELCLARIYHSIYFKEPETLKKLLEELEGYIAEHNYLEPIFILFRCFIYIILNDTYAKTFELVQEDLKYLSLFKKNYFTPDLQFLYMILFMYMGEKVDDQELEIYASQHKNLLWLYYYLRGSFSYLKKNDHDALVYYELAAQIFLDDYNIDRYSTVTNNLAFIYNSLGKYALSLENSSKMIRYAFSSKEANRKSKFSAKHYLFSCFMLDRYNEIIDFFNFINDLDFLEDMYVVIAIYTYVIKRVSEEEMASIVKMKLKENPNLSLVKNMFETKNINQEFFESLFKYNYWLKVLEKIEVDIKKM